MEVDEKRYAHLESPKGDSLFAAYDSLEIKLRTILIVASSEYLCKSRSLFWPDVIFLTVPNLDWGHAVVIATSVQRGVNLNSQVVILA